MNLLRILPPLALAALLAPTLALAGGPNTPEGQPETTPAGVTPRTVNLRLHIASTKPVSSLTLLDEDGQPVYEGTPTGTDLEVDGLQPGRYVAWVKVGKRIVTRRVRVY